MKARVQKIIANFGYCSRRKAEELIRAGRVSVNGRVAGIGDSADDEKDAITVEGMRLRAQRKVYILLNKPRGVETTLKSESGKKTVVSLLGLRERVIPAGRLDVDSSGLVILTNDGEVANRIMHPRYAIDKVYFAKVKGIMPEEKIEQLRKGIKLEEAVTSPCEVKVIRKSYETTQLAMRIHEGRKRQIRRMIEAVGFVVLELRREKIGPLTLKGLREGQHRELRPKEVKELKRALGMI